MPTVYELKTGTPVEFLKKDFLPNCHWSWPGPAGWTRTVPKPTVEMFPHCMIPRTICDDDQYTVGSQIAYFFKQRKDEIDKDMEIKVYSNVIHRIYTRDEQRNKLFEDKVFKDIVIVTFRTMGLSSTCDSGSNELPKSGEEMEKLPGRGETPLRRLYTYSIYSDHNGATPRTFFGPIHMPYFYNSRDSLPLTRHNVPVIYDLLTNFMENNVFTPHNYFLKVTDVNCVRIQYETPECTETT